MAKERANLRHRPPPSTSSSTSSSTSPTTSTSPTSESEGKGMGSWCSRLFYPYRLLLLFSLIVCLLQVT